LASLAAMSNKAFLLRWENGVSAPLDAGFAMFADALVAGIEALAKAKRGRAKRPPGRGS